MDLAKPGLDIGLYTNQLDPMLAFWREYADYDELLKLGGGAHQHRHRIGASILKLNHTREAIAQGHPTGLHQLCLYRDPHSSAPDQQQELRDPDGNHLSLRPSQQRRNLSITLQCNNLEQSAEFYGGVLALPTGATPHEFMVGDSSIILKPGHVGTFERLGLGYRYMTLQVFDVVSCHQHVVAQGGGEGMAPTRLGEVAYISFVLDPDGNWIELSQRKSITGSLD